MANWFRSKTAKPSISKTNPGDGSTFKIGVANGQKTWEEKVDLVISLSGVLQSQKIEHKTREGWLELESGFTLQPQIVSIEPLENGSVQSTTTIEVGHQKLIPHGLYEYQHATGDNPIDAVSQGFRYWIDTDLIVLLDSLNKELIHCNPLKKTFHDPKLGAYERRIVLGPTAHFVTNTADLENNEHPFCPCCLFMNSAEAFGRHLESKEFFGVRLFGMREDDGSIDADCRINGEDFAPGREALIKYVKTWPDRGFEFRKQYVCIQAVDL